MKTSRRLAGLFLAIVMLFTLAVGVSAASEGKITIDNAVVGQTYTIYRILDLESYNPTTGAYSYKANGEAWKNFVESTEINNVYLSTNEQGYVTWVGENTDARAAEFAKLAQAYAAENKLAHQGTQTATSTEEDVKTTTIKFNELDLGYYLVDTTLGTLCSLDTTTPSVTIKEKNAVPTNEKEVQEDSNNTFGKANDADIGQTVNFKSTITAQAGAENYVFHDKMTKGLTLDKTSIKVDDIAITDANGDDVTGDNYTISFGTIEDGETTFDIEFAQSYLNAITEAKTIVITYSATVNEKAVVGSTGNPNESWLDYGDKTNTKSTPKSTTTTYTWEIDVYKYTVNKDTKEEKALANAQFILYKDVKDGDNTTRYYATATAVDVGYRFTEWTTEKASATTFITPDSGKFAIKGLDSDTYYLEETQAPAGYNTLKAPVKVVIDDEGNVTYTYDGVDTVANTDVRILNNTGAELPSTGGIGTTIFYIVGAVLVLGASVLLVTKRRMKNDQQ